MDDNEVIRRVKKGEKDLFGLLVRRYEGKLYALAWRMLHNRADVEDVVQEAFVKSFRSLAKFRGEARFSTWIYRIALNVILNRLRKGSRFREADLDLERFESRQSPTRAARQADLKKQVVLAIQALPPRQRAIFHMRYEEERPHAEIAEILGLTEGAVKASYHHAVSKLRETLKEYITEEAR